MDVTLIMKSRNVFSANTGTFVYVFLVVTRENAKIESNECEVISHFVRPFYSDIDWMGKVVFFLFTPALYSYRLFHKLIAEENFSSRLVSKLLHFEKSKYIYYIFNKR